MRLRRLLVALTPLWLTACLGLGVAVVANDAGAKPPNCRVGDHRKPCQPTTTTSSSTTSTSTTTTTTPPCPEATMRRTVSTVAAVAFAAATLTGCDPSGEPAPVGDLPGWEQIFVDTFDYDVPRGQFPDAVSDRWGAYPEGWPDTSHNGTYSPHRVLSVEAGMLQWWIRTDPATGEHLVSVPYPLLPGANSGNGMLSGRYAVRFAADAHLLHQYKTAWLLWPEPGVWPQDGEIDFPEGDLDGTISGFVHHEDGTSGGDQSFVSTSTTYADWHTAVIEWVAGERVTFMLDGVVLRTFTERIPDGPMRWVLQTETALNGVEPADDVQGRVFVDWVAVWKAA